MKSSSLTLDLMSLINDHPILSDDQELIEILFVLFSGTYTIQCTYLFSTAVRQVDFLNEPLY